MKISYKKIVFTVAAVAFTAIGAQCMLPQQRAVAQEDNQPVAQQEEQTSEATYSYVAQVGDSYSLMARKAIQTYGIDNEVDLSQAQIIMAETNLTIEAGEPHLTPGQEVEIAAAAVKKWVDNAMAMSEEAEAAWQQYVQVVDFNTNNVGETR